MSIPNEWIDMVDILTDHARKQLEKGQYLSFDQDGVRKDYRVVKLEDDHVWVKLVKTYTPAEAKEKADADAAAFKENENDVDL